MLLPVLSPIFSLIFIIFLAFNAQANTVEAIKLPDIGESTGTLVSPAQEKAWGESFFRNLQTRVTLNQDAEIQEYIETIGLRLVASSDSPSIPFNFFVVMDNSINAFAGPGGYIGINAGLFVLTESESELASVMAHEIAHVTQRHIYRYYEALYKAKIPTLIATLAAILIGTQSPELGQAALIALQAGTIQYQTDFTRTNEQEADRVGMRTLIKADYDPNSMPTFFERLQRSDRHKDKEIPEFLRTHPITVSRIADTRGRAEKNPYRHFPDSWGYQLIKTKLRVYLATDLNATYQYFQKLQNQGTAEQRAVAQYGAGLVAGKLHNFTVARKNFNHLVKLYPEQAHFANAQAQIALATKNYKKALKLYQQALKISPNNKPLILEYLSALLKAGHPQTAKALLLPMLYEEKITPHIYKLLAQSFSALQQEAESHRYLSEYYYATGQIKAAITQVKLALKAKDLNFYLSSILDQRLIFFTMEEKISKLAQ